MDHTTACTEKELPSPQDGSLTVQPNSSKCLNEIDDGKNCLADLTKDSDASDALVTDTNSLKVLSVNLSDSDRNMQVDNVALETEKTSDGQKPLSESGTTGSICVDQIQSNTGDSIKAAFNPETKLGPEQGASQLDVPLQEALSCDPSVRIKMLARVSLSEAHFKHQQRGEPDLTMEEKIEIAQKILDENKVNFLSRFSQYLEIEDLEYFKTSRHIYEVDFYCNQVEKSKSGNFHRNRVKNRRYEAMKQLVNEGEYFSEEEMKFRDPYLYDQMIGQFLTDEEIQAKVDKSDLRFSSILIRHIDILDENARFARDRDKEEGQMEEEEEDSDEESEIETEKTTESGMEQDGDEKRKTLPEKERQELRQEFITIMQERFLSGGDKNFDYSKVDNSEQYDDLEVLNLDAEEKYFNDEDSESVHSADNMDI